MDWNVVGPNLTILAYKHESGHY